MEAVAHAAAISVISDRAEAYRRHGSNIGPSSSASASGEAISSYATPLHVLSTAAGSSRVPYADRRPALREAALVSFV